MQCIEAKGEYGKPVRIKCKNSVPSSFGTVSLMRSEELQSEMQLSERDSVSSDTLCRKCKLEIPACIYADILFS